MPSTFASTHASGFLKSQKLARFTSIGVVVSLAPSKALTATMPNASAMKPSATIRRQSTPYAAVCGSLVKNETKRFGASANASPTGPRKNTF